MIFINKLLILFFVCDIINSKGVIFINKDENYLKQRRDKFKSLIDQLDNKELIETSTVVQEGRYVCPICYETIFVSNNQPLPTCSKCGYNYLHKCPTYQK